MLPDALRRFAVSPSAEFLLRKTPYLGTAWLSGIILDLYSLVGMRPLFLTSAKTFPGAGRLSEKEIAIFSLVFPPRPMVQ